MPGVYFSTQVAGDVVRVVVPVVEIVAVWFLYVHLGRSRLGAGADWWERVRRTVLPRLNRVAGRNGLGYAALVLDYAEYAGRIDLSPEDTELVLGALGFERMPLAAYKYAPDGRGEVGSWAYRERLLARRQLHVILFEARGVTDLYAHAEYNAYNPATAAQHYLGIGYDSSAGVERVRELIEERTFHHLYRPTPHRE